MRLLGVGGGGDCQCLGRRNGEVRLRREGMREGGEEKAAYARERSRDL